MSDIESRLNAMVDHMRAMPDRANATEAPLNRQLPGNDKSRQVLGSGMTAEAV